MAPLTTKGRKRMSKRKFALPGSRKYPVNDRAHAIAAKGRATQMAKAGKISASTKARIHAAANKTLKRKK